MDAATTEAGRIDKNLKNTGLYIGPMTNTKALNIVCSREDYDSLSYFVYLYIGGRIGCILVINGATNLGTTVLTDVGLDYGYVKLYENTDCAVRSVSSIKEGTTVRVKIQMVNIRNDYRAYVKPLSRTAATGAATYTANWAAT